MPRPIRMNVKRIDVERITVSVEADFDNDEDAQKWGNDLVDYCTENDVDLPTSDETPEVDTSSDSESNEPQSGLESEES